MMQCYENATNNVEIKPYRVDSPRPDAETTVGLVLNKQCCDAHLRLKPRMAVSIDLNDTKSK